MLNEVRSRHIRKLVVENIREGRPASAIVEFEIARRADTVEGLKVQARREQDEISFLDSLDLESLVKEAGEKADG